MMAVQQDNGGEHVSPEDLGFGSTSSLQSPEDQEYHTMQVDTDYDDGADEKTDSAALFLRKFWRKVSAEPVTFDCFFSPKTQAYSCTLKLPMPGKTPRLFRSSPVYATKRSATRALAEYAIQCGILSEAGRSMDNLDKTTDPSTLAGPSRGPFDGSNNPRFARPGDADIHQNAVTLLNFAVQKHCVEPPNVVLDFVHHTEGSITGQHRGSIYRCDLRVRITPDTHEVYSTSQAFPSTRLAKEAVAQLALQDGVVFLFRLHNSMTTKISCSAGYAELKRLDYKLHPRTF
ncbi:hypothetical protein P389DRAFT_10361 [Cystobasidium minutum MCA 4210]|uniref:uncharacterized protein n=1 Tax=Cystobasidium minutum MCA 4210 TaxID=1397322 RepID=UPI0034CD5DB9|eukprot:jgi/Rhomi1/10361/CE10360_193